jgi:hypothetical protein
VRRGDVVAILAFVSLVRFAFSPCILLILLVEPDGIEPTTSSKPLTRETRLENGSRLQGFSVRF